MNTTIQEAKDSLEQTRLATERLIGILMKIARAAYALENYLSKNAGTTSDWPVDIQADNKEDADKLASLLTDLTRALEPYRFGK